MFEIFVLSVENISSSQTLMTLLHNCNINVLHLMFLFYYRLKIRECLLMNNN